MKKTIAIFGFKDALTGQVINMINETALYEIKLIISTEEIHPINIEEQHSLRPNRKTEFIENGKIFGVDCIYTSNYIPLLKENNIDAVFVLEDTGLQREKIFRELRNSDIEILSYIHKTTFLAGHNDIGKGVIIFPQCYIGYKTDINDGVIIQSNSTVEHHNVVGKFVNINPCLTTGGFTKIGDHSETHLSVNIINRIQIGNYCRIGAGSLVLNNTEDRGVYYGHPAKRIRENINH